MSEKYKAAGVDIEAGYEVVDRIKKHVGKTFNQGVMQNVGSFGALFDLAKYNIKDPVLVSGTDGVGTKLVIAQTFNRHETIGIDCVAMCVNDILAQGAMPLFFLDYLAVGKTDPVMIETIIQGIVEGCTQAGCALIGGETAEMNDLYQGDDYDLAGFAVGVQERDRLLKPEDTKPGQILIGLKSSGIHSNGFSLVRKLIFKDNDLDMNQSVDGMPLLNRLLTPTRIYVNSVMGLIDQNLVSGIAHITGGGFYENIERCLQKGLGVSINTHAWEKDEIFTLIQSLGDISDEEMYAIFNMGIGMVLVVDEAKVEPVCSHLKSKGETPVIMGEVIATPGVILR
ncbi:phosphoribosylaminoimidazole synthetase [Erysipelothrix larvae]|uniref:Phosphoribosylformylglycinamidine cyclo-ligase n=1 Tax=Erysipelothrix larvae TaxID=1514105 RepID=A0A0X8H0N5_9FIRM|nr:phosphoribosylformylglycinamidine cyclo-ligase [Erysipelothrix larvae]AMC93876.1 phosphoribosylaminoimidazole synthetase [Erysipelothrix larvae]